MDVTIAGIRARVRTKDLLIWILVIGIGIWGVYLGIGAYSGSLSRTLIAIEEGRLRTGLDGMWLRIAQSFRSVVLYAALAWLAMLLWGLYQGRTVQQVLSTGWVWVLAAGVASKLVGELLLNPSLFIDIVVGGLQKGFLYALIALGYTLVYGVVKLINFAHGDVFMVGAFASFYTISRLGMHQWPGSLYMQLVGGSEAPGWTLALGVFLVILVSTFWRPWCLVKREKWVMDSLARPQHRAQAARPARHESGTCRRTRRPTAPGRARVSGRAAGTSPACRDWRAARAESTAASRPRDGGRSHRQAQTRRPRRSRVSD